MKVHEHVEKRSILAVRQLAGRLALRFIDHRPPPLLCHPLSLSLTPSSLLCSNRVSKSIHQLRKVSTQKIRSLSLLTESVFFSPQLLFETFMHFFVTSLPPFFVECNGKGEGENTIKTLIDVSDFCFQIGCKRLGPDWNVCRYRYQLQLQLQIFANIAPPPMPSPLWRLLFC